jgi:hypothetical protein
MRRPLSMHMRRALSGSLVMHMYLNLAPSPQTPTPSLGDTGSRDSSAKSISSVFFVCVCVRAYVFVCVYTTTLTCT